MGRHSARRDTKNRKVKRLTDQPRTGGEGKEPKKEESGLPAITPAPVTGGPATASQGQATKAPKKSDYGQYVVPFLVACWRRVCIFPSFCDEHDGAITALATAAIVVLTTFYVSYSKKQWEALIESNRINRNVMAIDQRAWLTVRAVTLTHPLKLGEKPSAAIEIINSGKSPAIEARVAGTALSRRTLTEALAGPNVLGEPDSRAIVGPNVTLTVILDTSEAVATQGQIDAITSGQGTFYATGTIFYDDIFKTAHWTKFCFKMGSMETTGSEKTSWAACARGNSVDENK